VADPIQSNPVACDCEFVASVTNETLQLPWCGASGDAVWMADPLLAAIEQQKQEVFLEKSRVDVLVLLACS
jgi:hypothetical protein